MSLCHDEIIAVDDLVIGKAAEDLGDLFGSFAGDPPRVMRAEVRQAPREYLKIRVTGETQRVVRG